MRSIVSEHPKSTKSPTVALLVLVAILLILNIVIVLISWKAKNSESNIDETQVGKSIQETYSSQSSLDDEILNQADELERNAEEAYEGMSEQVAHTAGKLQESAVVAIDKFQIEAEKTGKLLQAKTVEVLDAFNEQMKRWNEANKKTST